MGTLGRAQSNSIATAPFVLATPSVDGAFDLEGVASMTRIPLRNRLGVVVAEAVVDDADAAWANRHRWSLNANGYAWRSIRGGTQHIYLHRAVLGLVLGDRIHADHVNRDKLDNRRSNLRRVTPAENRQNTPAIGGTSRHRGVSWDSSRGKWIANAQLDGRLHFIGRFASEDEARAAAEAWRREHMPFSEEGSDPSLGVIPVSIEFGGPSVTPPATDTTP